ncbi:MAG TPA: CBS domain-containing protein [Stackebrandtia sp.]|jgi:CBS domain-containing protein|uniref:CBS domain-containing protein n=1 Tax=Stackebrandtia sp. TaxID=2023065 RepID=UPI002D59B608|nr:CBS domain-containing protein [Stackebrandtia sp.]HZE42033.1 CBS domain-containing protein [Stackebrandtia sp.]
MRASDLATDFPTVTLDTPALEAARLMAGNDLPGLIVLGDNGSPCTVLAATQVLRMAVPRYIQDDPTLAGVIDEAAADTFVNGLGGRTVRELLPDETRELPVVPADATLLEIAALMAQVRIPIVAVLGADKRMTGAITADSLLDRVLAT